MRKIEGRRRRGAVDYFDGCWPGQDTQIKQVEIGYVVDGGFIDRVLAKRGISSTATNAEKADAVR